MIKSRHLLGFKEPSILNFQGKFRLHFEYLMYNDQRVNIYLLKTIGIELIELKYKTRQLQVV